MPANRYLLFQVLFLKKQAAPDDLQERKKFANLLAFFGVNVRDYIAKYEEENEERLLLIIIF